MWTMCSRSGMSSRWIRPGVQPLVVGVLGRELGLDLLVLDDPVLVGVDEEHPARLEPALADDGGGVEVEHADLGGEDHQAVVGDPVARGAQAVAVEDGPDLGAVGEHHARRPVPRLHQRGVEPVERAALRVHLGVVLPRLGDHHQHRVRQRPAAEVEQLEHLVERRGVGRAGAADREDPLQVAVEQVGVEQRLAGAHPVAVAHHGVDLAVVGDEPERVGQRPAREGVGGEPRVDHGQRGGDPLVGQVGVEVVELVGGEHPLVDQGPAGERGEVDLRLVLHPLAQAERQPLQRHPAHAGTGAGDEELAEHRHHAPGGGPEEVGLDGDLAPAEDREALLGRDLLDPPPGLRRPARRHPGGTPCRRRTTTAAAARSRPPRAGRRPGSASGCPPRRRSWARRRPRRGGRGCAGPSAPWPRCRGSTRRRGAPRTPRRRRRARGGGRRAPGPEARCERRRRERVLSWHRAFSRRRLRRSAGPCGGAQRTARGRQAGCTR